MLSEKLRDALDNLLPDAGEDEAYLGTPTLRDAAVLIAFTDRADPGVILTQRPQWLRSHAGQVAFPGGKIDPGDRDAIDAALREAEEEIGLNRRDVMIAGATEPYQSGSGYRITPVLGVIPPDLAFDPNPDEVEDWFEVPLDILFDPANYARQHANFQGHDRHYYDMDWQGRRIWGVTAGIIINLARRLPAGWHR
ncbi:CoA pyrophosphatase [Sphingopyxis sp. JAI128]|uniref:CoA pyrophosphatase n=1 Tax=Sphingopyxis sp. JAI128 TaxID=2723066 RepID=UPI0016138292|nr:CoA pyrophosphatase [Sphingopyxis sp. JAI128]MBB6425857.1 8-oxo-dGTP pyrophosphatase MutT (NUDIX family) [Sphingopyxis sp. JAI128]